MSQEWTKDVLSHLFVRFRVEDLTFPHCHAFEGVTSTRKSEPFTAICTGRSKIAVVELWASDASFSMVSDVAVLPDCSCDAPANWKTYLPMVKNVFHQVECASTCPTTGRMLGSEL